jgi:parallel beta-helix repeat protein
VGLITPPMKKEAPKLFSEKLARPSRQWLLLAFTVGLAVATAFSMVLAGAADAKNIVVPRDFPTIQAAVDAAPSGSTINVRRGVYREEVVIPKNLTLEGAGAGATIIKAPPTLTLNGTPVPAIVRITDGGTVSMSGFTVTGPILCSVELAAGIHVVKAATLKLTDSRVTRIRAENGSCPPGKPVGFGVFIGLPPSLEIDGKAGSTGHGTVTRVNVDRYQDHGIVVVGDLDGSPSTATISHNVITGGVPVIGPVAGQSGIDVGFGAEARVTGNTVRGNVCTASSCGPNPIKEFQSSGINAFLIGRNAAEISNNHVSGNDIGIYQAEAPKCCTISKNILRNNRFFGIAIQDGNGTTSHNTISGGKVGIGVVAGAKNTIGVLRGDDIRGTSVARIRELECCGFTATAIRAR